MRGGRPRLFLAAFLASFEGAPTVICKVAGSAALAALLASITAAGLLLIGAAVAVLTPPLAPCLRNEPEGSLTEQACRRAVQVILPSCASVPSIAKFRCSELQPSKLVSSAAAL